MENFAGQVDETLELSVDDLFKESEDSQPQEAASTKSEDNKAEQPEINLTENMKHRINDVRRKTEKDTQERIAKELGYNSYEEMIKAKESKLIKEHGFDEEDVEKLLNPLIESRLANDPRFKKLEEYEQREKNKYLNEQLAEINKISSVKYSSADDLPKDTIELWAKGVDLKTAYIATAGIDVIKTSANKVHKGDLSQMAPIPENKGVKTRGLTEYEKDIYRSIIPDITEAELSKKTIEIKE